MFLHGLLYYPTWNKVYACTAASVLAALCLVALRIIVLFERKRNIYKPAEMEAALYGAGAEEASAAGRKRIRRLVRNAAVCAACFGVGAVCIPAALRSYIVLVNWHDGGARVLIGDYVGAMVCYRKAMRVDPSLAHTHLLMGAALVEAGRLETAVPELEIAAQSETGDPAPVTALGDAYTMLGKNKEAAAAYQRAIDIAPFHPEYEIALAASLEKLHRLDDAYRAYEAALRIDPHCVAAHVKIGELLSSHGEMDQAMSHLQRAVALEPNNEIAHNTLALGYERCGMYRQAIAELGKSMALNPGSPIAPYNLGVTYEQLDRNKEALAIFRKCIKLTAHNMADSDAIGKARTEIQRLEVLR